MSLEWQARSGSLAWSNPVAVWWGLLTAVSAVNIAVWFILYHWLLEQPAGGIAGKSSIELMLLLCAGYVFGCAFRSLLPRADVQRICLFDTWLSSVALGRSVATIAEICFVIQWAIVLRQLADMTKSDTVRNVSAIIVPLIVLAEGFSWYAVVTTNYLGNTIENSLWAVSFLLIVVALVRLLGDFRGLARIAIAVALVGIAGYVIFLATIDVPMYFARWRQDLADGKALFGLLGGLHDVGTRWTVTHDVAHWRDEMAWMALYFSVAVWSSLALCSFDLVRQHLPYYRQVVHPTTIVTSRAKPATPVTRPTMAA
jgi:hypothetical protein